MPDIVFLPNRAGYDNDAEARFEDFRECCRGGYTSGWTCKKDVNRKDLYLFWFGDPIKKVAGVGVCNSDVDEQENEGVDWTPRRKLWFCSFYPLKELKHPVTVDHINDDPVLASWWQSQPWRGRPKSIKPEHVAFRLLSLITHLNPRLASLLGQYSSAVPESIRCIEIPDDDDDPPARVHYISSRTVRNTAKGERLKQLYEYKCQVCGYRIRVPRAGSGLYVEVHHLRPLGGKHRGRDSWDNMLVLCPNCHAEFDAHATAIDPKMRRIVCYDGRHPHSSRELNFRRGHSLATDNLEYHWKCFQKAKAKAAQIA